MLVKILNSSTTNSTIDIKNYRILISAKVIFLDFQKMKPSAKFSQNEAFWDHSPSKIYPTNYFSANYFYR